MIIKELEVESILTKTNLPDPWDKFVGVKARININRPKCHAGKEMLLSSEASRA